jgi:putative ABC transport system ATP-binding protein
MLQLVDIHKTWGTPARPVLALRGVSFTLAVGEFCAVVGPSGSGKSTLMSIIGLLDRPSRGRVLLDGVVLDIDRAEEAARLRNRTLGFVFQSFQLLPRLSAWQNVALPLLYRGVAREDRRPRALAMLDQVGLAHRADHRPAALSGGESQRVALARALVGEPRVILADEPTGNLDSVTARGMMDLLRDLNERLGVTVLVVTHDGELAHTCDRRIELLDGRIVADTARS